MPLDRRVVHKMGAPWFKVGLFKRILVVMVVFSAVGVGFLFFRTSEMTLSVSVQFSNLSEGLVIAGKVPPVEVLVKGPVRVLNGLKGSKLLYNVNMGSVEPGKAYLEIDQERIAVPDNVTVVSVDPASFVVPVDEAAKKWVPIVPDVEGEPAAGYVMSSLKASPAQVEITGPATMLGRISALRTTPIDLAGLKESTTRNVAVSLSDLAEVQVPGDGLVEVDIEIEEKIVENRVTLSVQPIGTDRRCEVIPSQIEVLLEGPEKAFRKLGTHAGVDVRVDLEGLEPGTYFRHAIIEPPLDIVVLDAQPTTFKVEIFENG